MECMEGLFDTCLSRDRSIKCWSGTEDGGGHERRAGIHEGRTALEPLILQQVRDCQPPGDIHSQQPWWNHHRSVIHTI